MKWKGSNKVLVTNSICGLKRTTALHQRAWESYKNSSPDRCSCVITQELMSFQTKPTGFFPQKWGKSYVDTSTSWSLHTYNEQVMQQMIILFRVTEDQSLTVSATDDNVESTLINPMQPVLCTDGYHRISKRLFATAGGMLQMNRKFAANYRRKIMVSKFHHRNSRVCGNNSGSVLCWSTESAAAIKKF